jgi:hypothetical protein
LKKKIKKRTIDYQHPNIYKIIHQIQHYIKILLLLLLILDYFSSL